MFAVNEQAIILPSAWEWQYFPKKTESTKFLEGHVGTVISLADNEFGRYAVLRVQEYMPGAIAVRLTDLAPYYDNPNEADDDGYILEV